VGEIVPQIVGYSNDYNDSSLILKPEEEFATKRIYTQKATQSCDIC